MFKLLVKVTLIVCMLSLLSLQVTKGYAKTQTPYLCFNCSEQTAKTLPYSIAPVKTYSIGCYSIENECIDLLTKKIRKAELNSFYPTPSLNLINSLSITYRKTAFPNPIPIYITTHDYRL